jgi:hypothetical protein
LVVAGAGAKIMQFEDIAFFHLTKSPSEQLILIAEAGVAIALALNIGFEGSQALLGVVLGVWASYKLHAFSADLHVQSPLFFWYSGGGMLGMCLVLCCRRPVLAVLSPLLGGLLIASGGGSLISRGLADYAAKQNPVPSWLTEIANFFPAHDEAWISGCRSLFGENDPFLNIAVQCGWGLIGIVVHKFCKNRRGPAVGIVVLGIVGSAAWGAISLGCKVLPPGCPAKTPWKWLLSGSILWLLVAALSLLRHLIILERLGSGFLVPFYMRPLQKASSDWQLDWKDLSDSQRDAAVALGFSRETWNSKNPKDTPWQELVQEQREAAKSFGWTQASWDTALWLEVGIEDSPSREVLLTDYTGYGYSRCSTS